MRILLFLILIMTLAIWFIACSDSGTDPGGGDPVDEDCRGLDISYISEPASAVTATVTPESGGTVTATGTNGVFYSLEVSPGALDATCAYQKASLHRH